MGMPHISVVMAEYNTDLLHLHQAIQSILNQTYINFECIIVDDGGKNDLQEIVDSFNDTRLKIVKNNRNHGLVYSLNKGIKAARGKYIVRMDTDDIAEPNRIERLYDFITCHPEYAVVGSRAVEFDGSTIKGILSKRGEKTAKQIASGDVIIHPSALIRKSALEHVGGYKNFHRAEDLALWCDLLLTGYRLYVVNDILLKYRVTEDDYKKRSLKNRFGELKVRLYYYPRLRVRPAAYARIFKSIAAGIVPYKYVQKYRQKYILKSVSKKETIL